MDDRTQIELEAAAFRTLVAHLRKRTDVQNIELMNLAGFCRNCLSKWYRAAAEEKGLDMDLEEARQLVYGMTYAEWKEHFQTEATPEQKRKYAEEAAKHGLLTGFIRIPQAPDRRAAPRVPALPLDGRPTPRGCSVLE